MDLNQQISNNIEDILFEIGISDFTRYKNRLALPCPVHSGDNTEACSIFLDNDKYCPNWKCFTHFCHKGQSSLTSLICLLLDKDFRDTVYWLKTFGIEREKVDFNRDEYSFVKSCKTLNLDNREQTTIKPLPLGVLTKLCRPVDYYLNRGFRKETLDEFQIGICREKGKFFYNRIVVPIFNETKEFIVGFTGRTLYPQCPICDKYHHKNISCLYKTRKWANSKDFNTNSYLYNYWNAKDAIRDSGKVYLVEGQADVWRFWEAGIKNVVGLFGISASLEQQILLEKSGATNITLFLDPDEAGEDGFNKFVESLERFYTIDKIDCDKQPSECTVEELKTLVE